MFVTVSKLAGSYFGSFKMVPEEKKNTSSNYTEVIFLLMSNSVSGRVAQIKKVIALMAYFLLSDH